MDISVIIPVRDEAEIIPELIARLVATLEKMGLSYEVIFVTDTNRDNTVEVLRAQNRLNSRIKVVKFDPAGSISLRWPDWMPVVGIRLS